jgi:hypothetical protein
LEGIIGDPIEEFKMEGSEREKIGGGKLPNMEKITREGGFVWIVLFC